MGTSTSAGTVLLTGCTGYLAGWIAIELLDRGYQVRGTVRDLDRADSARRAILARSSGPGELNLVRADLLDDAGWSEAIEDVDAVLHTASPMPFGSGVDLVHTAREGTRRVLETAAAAGVSRVVLTSSGTAAMPADRAVIGTESVWSEPSGESRHAYPDSKIHAERLAWELAEALDLRLTTVLPAFMQGPPVGSPAVGTIDVIRRLLDRAMPALPRLGWNVVDVRDVATLHVLALENRRSIGERYQACGTFLWYRDIARILRQGLPQEARKVPTRQLPDVVVRLAARRDPHLAMVADELGLPHLADNRKARTELGWAPRDVRTTILDTARALAAPGTPAPEVTEAVR